MLDDLGEKIKESQRLLNRSRCPRRFLLAMFDVRGYIWHGCHTNRGEDSVELVCPFPRFF